MYTIKGKVIDYKTGKALVNLNVTVTDSSGEYLPVNGVNVGRITDKRGTFVIPVANEDAFVTFSSVGYKKLTIPAAAAAKKTSYKMMPLVDEIPEVVISTPAAKSLAAMVPDNANKKVWMIGLAVSGLILVGALIYILNKK